MVASTPPTNGLIVEGSVGIGTASPSQKLHVVGKALITDDVQLTGSSPRIDFNTNGASSLRFYDTTNAAERMRINTSGNLGINTTSPTSKLQVVGSTSGDSVLKVDGTNGTLFEVVDDLSDSLMSVNDAAGLPVFEVFADNHIVAGRYNQNDFYLNTSGNLGLGTSSPITKLNIKGDQSADGQLYIEPTNDGEYAGLVIKTTRGADRAYAIFAGGTGTDDLNFRFRDATAGADRMVIDSSGKVGIGTASPEGKLHVFSASAGTVTASSVADELVLEGSGDSGLTILSPDNKESNIFLGGPGLSYGGILRWKHSDLQLTLATSVSNAFIAFYTDTGTERMRITSAGSVGIGTTSPGEKLEIQQNGNYQLKLTNGSTGGGNVRIAYADNTFGSGGSKVIFDLDNGGSANAEFVIQSDGNVGIGTTSPDYTLHTQGTIYASSRIGAQAVNTSYLATLGGSSDAKLLLTGSSSPYIRFQESTTNRAYIQWLSTTDSLKFQNQQGDYFDFSTHDEGSIGLRLMGFSGSLWGYVYATASSEGGKNIGLLDGGGSWAIRHIEDTKTEWRIDNDIKMTLLESGNLGIGVTDPDALLEVKNSDRFQLKVSGWSPDGAGESAGAIQIGDTDAYCGRIYVDNTNTKLHITNTYNSGNGDIVFLTKTAGTANNVMTLKGNGNVGIGTPSPTAKIHVKDDSGSPTGLAAIIDRPNNLAAVDQTADNPELLISGHSSNYKLVIRDHSSNELMVVKGDGSVGIGTTSPGGKLHVYGGTTAFTNLSDNTDSIQITRNTSVHSHPDAKLFIYDNSNSDYAQKIDLAGYSYGLRIEGFVDYGLEVHHQTLGLVLAARSSELVINENGNDYNFRVEGETDVNLLQCDASRDSVGIGGSPNSSYKLDVAGDTLIQESESGDLKLVVNNVSTSTLARSAVSLINNSGSSAGFALPSTNYTGITGWANRLILNTDSNISNGILVRPSTGGFTVSANGLANTNLRVDTNGRVGVNTASPSYDLDVIGDISSNGQSIASYRRLRSYDNFTTSTNNTAGWYPLFSWGTTTGDRGGYRVYISYTGGNWAPNTTVLKVFKNWSSDATVTVEKYGGTLYLPEVRVIGDASTATVYTLELYLNALSQGHSFSVYYEALGYDETGASNVNWANSSLVLSTNTGSVIGSAKVSSEGIATQNLNISNDIYLGDQIIHMNDSNTYFQFHNNDNMRLVANSVERFNIETTETVVNESGGNHDFRVEGDTDQNLLFVDASTDRVGIGTTIPSQKLDVRGNFRLNGAIAQYSTTANSTVLNRFWNNTGGVLLAELALYDFGTFLLGGQLSFGEGISKYATLRGTNTDGGKLTLETTSSSTNVIINGNGDTVFNETGAAFDFRIEGDTNANLFFVDGSADKIGIGTNAPAQLLHVHGVTQLGAAGKTEGGAVLNYASFGETKSSASTILGNAIVPGTANSTVQRSKSDAGNFVRLKYNTGICFHTNVTSTINTDIAETTNERVRINLTGSLLISDGLVGTPSLSFINDTNTGMWRPGSDQLRLVTGGSDAIVINSSQAIQLPDYGSGNNTGTRAYFLAVDSAGNIIEDSGGGGGTIGDGTITLAAGTGLTGGGSFSTNQAANATITFNATGGGGSGSGTVSEVTVGDWVSCDKWDYHPSHKS